MTDVNVLELQRPLRAKYKTEPGAAMVIDSAHAGAPRADDPFHTSVEPKVGSGVAVPVGVHRALGGPHDAPTGGDILCCALAGCMDSTIRMVANLLGIELKSLEIDVTGQVDVRGTLAMDEQVPVGLQTMQCTARFTAMEGTRPELLRKLQFAAERSCVVLQTLRQSPVIETRFENLAQAVEHSMT